MFSLEILSFWLHFNNFPKDLIALSLIFIRMYLACSIFFQMFNILIWIHTLRTYLAKIFDDQSDNSVLFMISTIVK